MNQLHSGFDLIDGHAIDLEEAVGTDHTYTGMTCQGKAGEVLAFGELCYFRPETSYSDWAALTVYGLNVFVTPTVPNGFCYQCTTAGTSGAGEPVWPVIPGNTVADGTVVWTCRNIEYFWRADADAAATTEGHLAIALGAIAVNANGLFLLFGFIRDDDWAWTVADVLYVSTDPGDLQNAAPAGAGDQIRKVGYAHTADIIWFWPDSTILEVA